MLLGLLAERPQHGYELIKELEASANVEQGNRVRELLAQVKREIYKILAE
jgi:DNA-binding PadR family transcriptional regulator